MCLKVDIINMKGEVRVLLYNLTGDGSKEADSIIG